MQARFGSTTLRISLGSLPACDGLNSLRSCFHFPFPTIIQIVNCYNPRKAEYTVEAFNSLNPNATLTKQQYHALDSANMRIWEVVAKVADKIDYLKEDYVQWMEGEGKALAAQAVLARRISSHTGDQRVQQPSEETSLCSSMVLKIPRLTRARSSREISSPVPDASGSVA